MMIKHAYSDLKKSHKINFATMHCNSQTNAQHVIQKLYQLCQRINSGSGKLLRPKECYRQVLYLKDINLPKPDKYQTIQLVSFLQQVISHKGFYDPQTLEFVAIDEKIQIVASMLPPNSIGRNQLSQRFTAIVRILNFDYPTNEELVSIFTEYFRALLKAKEMEVGFSQPLAQFLVDSYNQILANFSVDTHRHYNFTPKHLFKIFKSLIKYEFSDKEALAEALTNELFAHFRNKLVSLESKSKFEQIIFGLAKTHFKLQFKSKQLFSVISGKNQKIPK
jgi:dynein heavy chain 2